MTAGCLVRKGGKTAYSMLYYYIMQEKSFCQCQSEKLISPINYLYDCNTMPQSPITLSKFKLGPY